MARSDRVESMGGGAPSGIGSRAAARVKIDSNPKPLTENQRLKNNFNAWASRQPQMRKDFKPTVKVNSNPNQTPARTSSNVKGRNPKYDADANAWNSREGVDDYGNPTYNAKAPIKPLKINTNPKPVTNHQPRIGGHAS